MLDQDLILTPDSGAVIVTQYELGNTYGRVGGAYSNYKPRADCRRRVALARLGDRTWGHQHGPDQTTRRLRETGPIPHGGRKEASRRGS